MSIKFKSKWLRITAGAKRTKDEIGGFSEVISKKDLVIFTMIALAGSSVYGQDEKKQVDGWKNSVVGNLNLSQSSFSNWSKGGQSAVTWQVLLAGKLINEHKKYNWTTDGNFTYGETKLGEARSRKSLDEIKIASVFTYKLGVYINPYIAATAQTQSTDGFTYASAEDQGTRVSGLLDPAYFTQSIGFGYAPTKSTKTRLGASLKESIANKFSARYTDDPSTPKLEKQRIEIGFESVTTSEIQINKTAKVASSLQLFSNLESIKTVDVDWVLTLQSNISKYVNMNFNVQLLYDQDISKKRQIKQALAIGFTYNFL